MVLLGFAGIEDVLPFLFVPVVFVLVFVVIVVALVKRVSAEKRKREMDEYNNQPLFTDGSGRTDYQREYLAEKRRQLAEQKLKATNNAHSHAGSKTEKYAKIVGSLGEINDEGCEDLDGVRLIDHDEAYCDDPDHTISTEPTELECAIVLGEALNTPRYKQMYRRK